jgi:hypothetical protein
VSRTKLKEVINMMREGGDLKGEFDVNKLFVPGLTLAVD